MNNNISINDLKELQDYLIHKYNTSEHNYIIQNSYGITGIIIHVNYEVESDPFIDLLKIFEDKIHHFF